MYILFSLLSGQSNNILAHMIIVASEFVFLRFLSTTLGKEISLKPYTFNHAGFHVNVPEYALVLGKQIFFNLDWQKPTVVTTV